MQHIPGHSNNAADALSRLAGFSDFVSFIRLLRCKLRWYRNFVISKLLWLLLLNQLIHLVFVLIVYFAFKLVLLFFPLTELTLQRYAASMANRVGFKTIKVYLCGVQYLSIMSGFDVQISSFMRLYYTLHGIRRIQGSRFGRQRRLPISISQLLFIHHRVQLQRYSHFEGLMLRTSTSLAFFGLLRCSEFTTATRSSFVVSCDLLVQDISFSGAFSIMKVHIKASEDRSFS